MNRITRALRRLAHGPHERVLLIEEKNGAYEGESAVVKDARSVEIRSAKAFKDLARIPFRRFPLSRYDTAILALGDRSAATIEGTVRLARDDRAGAIDESELDALLHHGFWNFLNTYRSVAAEKLGVSELDMVVAYVAVNGVRIGTHAVFNPVDFAGREVFLSFRATFVPRAFLPVTRDVAAHARTVIVVERGAILAASCGAPVVFAEIGDRRSVAYSAGEGEAMFKGALEWGTERIVKALAEFFGTDSSVVPALLNRYTNSQISERARLVVNRIAREEMRKPEAWLRGIAGEEKKKRRVSACYAVSSSVRVPRELLEGLSAAPAAFQEPHGAPPERNRSVSDLKVSDAARTLISFPYLHPHYQPINQLLQRRVKWLVPH